MRSIILDLETIPHPDAHKWADPVKPDSRLVDPVKIAKSIEDKTAERDDNFGLDADFCRIAAIGYHVVGEAEPEVFLCSDEFEEREHIKKLWDLYQYGKTRFITYNGHRFDLPVLLMRSLYLQVKHQPLEIPAAWKTDSHVDLYVRMSCNGARDRKDVKGLRFYAKRLGLPIYDDIDGSQVAAMVKAGDWEKVRNHCLFDLDLTRALAERLDVLKPIGVAA
jgi:predicted PolB exonuclease-like 3'-5' exonuclease